MNEKTVVLTKESSENELKSYFTAVLNLSQSSKEFPVNLDDVWPLVYGKKADAVEALVNNNQFMQDVDYQVLRKNPQNPQGGRPTIEYYLTTSCLEFFIARKVRSVFEVYRQVFHKAAQTFTVPQTFAEALMLAAKQQQAIEEKQRQIEQKNTEIKAKDAQITELGAAVTEMRPKVSYVDMVLQCRDTVQTTIIAQDYGMSAKAFNILLRNMRVQRKVGATWVVYGKYLQCGYVQSKTFTYQHKDGTTGARTYMEWTQKGRLFLYETLKRHSVLPLIEQPANDRKEVSHD